MLRRSLRMAPDGGAVDHVLPVIGESEFDQRIQKRTPHALLSPAPETDIDRVPLVVSLVHVAPGAADPQDVEHATEKALVIPGSA